MKKPNLSPIYKVRRTGPIHLDQTDSVSFKAQFLFFLFFTPLLLPAPPAPFVFSFILFYVLPSFLFYFASHFIIYIIISIFKLCHLFYYMEHRM